MCRCQSLQTDFRRHFFRGLYTSYREFRLQYGRCIHPEIPETHCWQMAIEAIAQPEITG